MRPPDIKEERPWIISQAIRQLAEGRSNAAGTVTLGTSVATTTVTSEVISADCYPQLTPASANGATEMGNGTIYVSSVLDGSFIITHANNATADRTFHWHAVGG